MRPWLHAWGARMFGSYYLGNEGSLTDTHGQPIPQVRPHSSPYSADSHADRLDRMRPSPRSLDLSFVRRRFVLPAQDENGDVVSRVLATDQGSHHRVADILRRPG
jgi:hypothetical protein